MYEGMDLPKGLFYDIFLLYNRIYILVESNIVDRWGIVIFVYFIYCKLVEINVFHFSQVKMDTNLYIPKTQ